MRRTTRTRLIATMILTYCATSDVSAQTTRPATQPVSKPAASQPAKKPKRPLLPIGSKAPKFEARTLSGLDVRFPDDYAGQLVLLQLWASWCPSCGRDYPHWVKAQEAFGDQGLTLLGISLDYQKKIDPAEVQIAMDERGGTWEVIYENARQIEKMYVTPYLPTLYLIDGDTGKIVEAGDNLRRGRIMKTLAKFMHQKFPDRFPAPPPDSQPTPQSQPAAPQEPAPASRPAKP